MLCRAHVALNTIATIINIESLDKKQSLRDAVALVKKIQKNGTNFAIACLPL
jgi:hypothetical protein